MSTYLYTWNPERWSWADQADAIYRVNNGQPYDMYWSCGNTRKIKVGDTFLLMKLGVAPKGIIGCGYIASVPYALPHWDAHKAAQGMTSSRTDLLFKALAEKPIVSLNYLNDRYPNHNWTPQAGGLSVPPDISDNVLSLIQGSPLYRFPASSAREIELYAEGKSRTITSKTYDRSPAARQACIEHHGYRCSVCDFCFGEAYGPLGARYIEVHHLKQIADFNEEHLINPVKDLRPVCANCHRMLHKQRPPLSIDELKAQKNSLASKPLRGSA